MSWTRAGIVFGMLLGVAVSASCGRTRRDSGSVADVGGGANTPGDGARAGSSGMGGAGARAGAGGDAGGVNGAGRSGSGGTATAGGCVPVATLTSDCAPPLRFGAHTLESPGATRVQAADLDGDGAPDLVTSREVWFGLGKGEFEAKAWSEDEDARLVAVEPFDAEDGLDLLITNAKTGQLTLLGSRPGREFSELTRLAGSPNPDAIAVADLNGDEILDLAIGDARAEAPLVLLGRGDGTFETQLTTPLLAEESLSLVLGELNGDAFTDAAVLRPSESVIQVLRGDGVGRFLPPFEVAVESAWSLALAHVNDDDALDIVTTHSSSAVPSIQTRLGDGAFGFETGPSIDGLLYPTSALVLDATQDGVPDFIASFANSDGRGVLYPGNADGTYPRGGVELSRRLTYESAVHDLNGDGAPDIALAHGDLVSIAWGSAAGVFSVPHAHASVTEATSMNAFATHRGLALGDLDGDGVLDVIAAASSDKPLEARVLLGNGDGTFRDVGGFGLAAWHGPPVIADFDRDANLDVALPMGAAFGATTVYLFLGDGDGGFDAGRDLGVPAARVIAEDADQDGDLDLLAADPRIEWWLNQGEGSFEAGVAGPSFISTLLSLGTADLECDGYSDAIVGGYYWLGVARGAAASEFDSASNFHVLSDAIVDGPGEFPSIVVGDVNLDSIPDVVAAQPGAPPSPITGEGAVTGAVFIFLGDGQGGFAPPLSLDGASSARAIALGDLDGDGWPDLVVSGSNDGVSVRRGLGKGAFGEPSNLNLALGYAQPSLVLGDLDGDDRLDLVVFLGDTFVSVLNTSFGECKRP